MGIKESKKMRIVSFFILVIFIGMVFAIYLDGEKSAKRHCQNILKDSVFYIARVVKIERKAKVTDAFYYEFGLPYGFLASSYSSSYVRHYPEVYPYLIGRTFPVILSKSNPEKYSQILICKEDFKKFNLDFPDSLRWVERLIDR